MDGGRLSTRARIERVGLGARRLAPVRPARVRTALPGRAARDQPRLPDAPQLRLDRGTLRPVEAPGRTELPAPCRGGVHDGGRAGPLAPPGRDEPLVAQRAAAAGE